jgi:hypothetical protein
LLGCGTRESPPASLHRIEHPPELVKGATYLHSLQGCGSCELGMSNRDNGGKGPDEEGATRKQPSADPTNTTSSIVPECASHTELEYLQLEVGRPSSLPLVGMWRCDCVLHPRRIAACQPDRAARPRPRALAPRHTYQDILHSQ